MLSQALTQFALRLICGMALMLATSDYRKTSSGFYRIQMLVVMGLGVLASMFAGTGGTIEQNAILSSTWLTVDCVVIAVLAFLGSVLWMLERKAGAYRLVLLILAAAVAGLAMGAFRNSDAVSPVWFQWISDVSSGAILGGAMTGMLLGHWYLTAPEMSLDPLLRMTKFYGIAAVVRLLVSAVALWWGWLEIAGLTMVMLLLMRWCFGVLAPLVTYWMAWRILKYRNTQAATGVLFVGVIVTFLGELSGILLFFELGATF
ncbi:hypothetical protein [Symmachiella dynata]|uniref:hypothetical protein n=1 Tax=Symmachiella dynata TaxID=2527995 RepID=UPI0030EE3F0D